MDVDYVRIVNFAIIATSGAWMFVRVNESLSRHRLPIRFLLLSVVGFYTTVAGGSLEAFYRQAPMSWSAWFLLLFASLTIVCLYLTRGGSGSLFLSSSPSEE